MEVQTSVVCGTYHWPMRLPVPYQLRSGYNAQNHAHAGLPPLDLSHLVIAHLVPFLTCAHQGSEPAGTEWRESGHSQYARKACSQGLMGLRLVGLRHYLRGIT